MRHDADDIAYPQRVERTLEHISKYPDAGIFTSIAEYYPPNRSLGKFRASKGSPEELRRIVETGYLLTFCHPSATLNVQKTLQVGGYSELLQHAEDADLWWRMALMHDIRIIPEVLLGYRQHSRQATTRAMKENVVDLLYVQYLLISKLRNLVPLSKESVRPLLGKFVSARQLIAKDRLRRVNIRAANHDILGAVAFAMGAFIASPKFMVNRICDEFWGSRSIVNGISPEIFSREKEYLWHLSSENEHALEASKSSYDKVLDCR
jgi:hypothetical protein